MVIRSSAALAWQIISLQNLSAMNCKKWTISWMATFLVTGLNFYRRVTPRQFLSSDYFQINKNNWEKNCTYLHLHNVGKYNWQLQWNPLPNCLVSSVWKENFITSVDSGWLCSLIMAKNGRDLVTVVFGVHTIQKGIVQRPAGWLLIRMSKQWQQILNSAEPYKVRSCVRVLVQELGKSFSILTPLEKMGQ